MSEAAADRRRRCDIFDALLSTRCAVSLKPDLFEGLRFDLTKPLNHNFALSHSIFMGNIDVPTANNQVHTMSRACSLQLRGSSA